MSDRLDIAKFKQEQGLLAEKGAPSTAGADGLLKLFGGIKADVDAKAETRQAFKEESASDIRDLRSLRAEAQAAGATDDKSASGQSIKLGDIPTSTTLANWTLSQLDGFIQDSYAQQEVVTSGLGGPFAVRDYGIFKNNQKQTWQAVKGRADAAGAELEQTIKNAQGYTNDSGVFVPPTAGAGEAAFQRYQSIIGDLNNTKVRSGEDGMGIVEVYQTVYDPATGVQKRVLDKDGNPIINKNVSGTSVMALLNGQNSRWQRTDVIGAVDESFGKDVIASFEVPVTQSGYMKGSSVEDNIRRNSSFTRYQDSFIEKTLPNNRAVSSTLTDNFNGEFYQLDPDQTGSGMVNGKKIDITEMITVKVLTGYDTDGKAIYEDKKAPKYIGSKLEGDDIVVQTTDEHKVAAAGIIRGVVDGKIGKGIEGGVAYEQYDPYRATKQAADKQKVAGVDLFKQIEKSFDGTDEQIRHYIEGLMVSSNFKFNKTSTQKASDGTVLSNTFYVDKGDGVFKSIKLTMRTENPKHKTDPTAPKYISLSKEQYEDKMYELFKGSDDNTSVSEARKNYISNGNKYSPTGTFNAGADRNMEITTKEEINVPAIPSVSVNTQIGNQSAIEKVTGSTAYKSIESNWRGGGVKNSTTQLQGLQGELQSTFDALNAEQQGGQGLNVQVKYDANTAEFYFDGNDGNVTERVSVAVSNKNLTGQVQKLLADAITLFLPGKVAGVRTKISKGGVEVQCINGFIYNGGLKTTEQC